MKKMVLNEISVVADLHAFIHECDCDDLAALFGHVFGLNVVAWDEQDPTMYACVPIDGEYAGHRENQLKEDDGGKAAP